jgi:hypothetical protein
MVVYDNKRKPMDMVDYKKQVLECQAGYCPITFEECESIDGEIICCNRVDYFVSRSGIRFLRDALGEDFINKRIVYELEQGTEDNDEEYYPEY